MSHSIEVVDSKLYAGVVADEIIASLNDAISERGSCSLVLAGGGTPASIYRALSKPPRASYVDWSKVRLYLGDERWVSRADNQSNAKMVQETLVAQIPQPGPAFFVVDTDLASAEQGAQAYAALIAEQEKLAAGRNVEFDLVLLGCGEDGHTASLFPNSPLVTAVPPAALKLCASVVHPKGGDRISLTPQALFSARKIIFMVTGANKASIVQRVIEGQEPPALLPARLFTSAAGTVVWFLDSEAAQQLKSRESAG